MSVYLRPPEYDVPEWTDVSPQHLYRGQKVWEVPDDLYQRYNDALELVVAIGEEISKCPVVTPLPI